MSEKPIIMSAWSVRGILADRKTATRRVDKPGATRYEVGDRLWVREALNRATPKTVAPGPEITFYQADSTTVHWGRRLMLWRWKRDMLPAMFMPREAARIWLEVTGVRAERLQDITPEDVEAEGVELAPKLPVIVSLPAEPPSPAIKPENIDKLMKLIPGQLFKELWDSLNAKRGYGWDINPTVSVISFKKLDNP